MIPIADRRPIFRSPHRHALDRLRVRVGEDGFVAVDIGASHIRWIATAHAPASEPVGRIRTPFPAAV